MLEENNKKSKVEIVLHNEEETKEFAFAFAKNLKGGEVIALVGDLGVGKTTFVKYVAKALGIKKNVTSPTFVLMKEYTVNCQLSTVNHIIHIDCYRMKSIEDALSLGITDYLGKKDVIMFIEWPDKIKNILAKDTIQIKFEHISQNTRKVSVALFS